MRASRFRYLIVVIIVTISCLSAVSVARADMEGRVPFAHAEYSSAGLDNSGPIHVGVFQSETGISKVAVSAFGKDYVIDKKQLASLNGYLFNAIGVSYSRGYKRIGGRTVYVLLYQAFSTGTAAVAMVVIREHGPPSVVLEKR